MPENTARLSTALADRYQIERHLGEGGMANVYLAHDVKHDRKVAVKVLRPELAAVLGAERFVQEIKTTANLQHPHILPLHDSGDADGFLYYVMPFIDGETLRDKLNRETQLGIEEAVKITTEVADALDYAHRNNVIHRDIKPENILLHDGRPMVADFGIALALSAAAGGRMTETGMSLGTPHYMSPEQATAEKDLTNRSDIYSLGCVLYEMLTGEPPHVGGSAQQIIMKIVTDTPRPVTELRKSVPSHVAAATAKSLEKLAADRFETAKEFAEALTNPAFTLPAMLTAPLAGASARGAWNRVSIATSALAVVFLALALWLWLRPAGPVPRVRFELTFPSEQRLVPDAGPLSSVVLSPDGTTLVYVGRSEAGRLLYERPLDQLEARPIAGTDGATGAFFSPDGASVGFWAEGSLKKVALDGGPALKVADAPENRGATWEGDFIVFTPTASSGLFRVAAAGGPIETLTTPNVDAGETSHRWPYVLPDRKGLIFTVWRGSAEDTGIAALGPKTDEIKPLLDSALHAIYAPTGHLVYAKTDGSLLAVPFDPGNLEVTGRPTSLIEGVVIEPFMAEAEFTLSESGMLAYVSGVAAKARLTLVDRQGVELQLTDYLDEPGSPRFSPDGSLVALEIERQGRRDIWIYDLEQGTSTRLTLTGNNWYAEWSPDGTRVAFSSDRADAENRDMFWKPVYRGGLAEPLLTGEHEQWEVSWPRDGRFMMYRQRHPDTGRDLWILPQEGDRTPLPYLRTPADERAPAVSPDGRWVAYTSNESGRDEVYVGALPAFSNRWLVSSGGGKEPRWAPNGRELIYRNGREFVSVAVTGLREFKLGRRTILFEGDYDESENHAGYDLHPDGDRFVVLKRGEGDFQLIVVLNFFEELKEKVGN